MNPIKFAYSNERGFTFIEIIVTLIIAAILGVILIQFMGSSVSGSAENVQRIKDGFVLNQEMEKITRDYRNWLKTSPDDSITVFETAVNTNYADIIVSGETGIIEVDPGNDGDVEIFQVTITDGTQTLMALFTK
ncbi:MAG: type II secretion system protein [Acidobacteriota bacterium]|nr:type II secretion system protein [Acidobacteriota bacterium]